MTEAEVAVMDQSTSHLQQQLMVQFRDKHNACHVHHYMCNSKYWVWVFQVRKTDIRRKVPHSSLSALHFHIHQYLLQGKWRS